MSSIGVLLFNGWVSRRLGCRSWWWSNPPNFPADPRSHETKNDSPFKSAGTGTSPTVKNTITNNVVPKSPFFLRIKASVSTCKYKTKTIIARLDHFIHDSQRAYHFQIWISIGLQHDRNTSLIFGLSWECMGYLHKSWRKKQQIALKALDWKMICLLGCSTQNNESANYPDSISKPPPAHCKRVVHKLRWLWIAGNIYITYTLNHKRNQSGLTLAQRKENKITAYQ